VPWIFSDCRYKTGGHPNKSLKEGSTEFRNWEFVPKSFF
jgi:hypothetical protein